MKDLHDFRLNFANRNCQQTKNQELGALHPCNEKLLNTFRLARERAHDLAGFQARLAAKVALHNFCLWFNLRLVRPPLAKASLLNTQHFTPSV